MSRHRPNSHTARKRFGQNFLTDASVIAHIIRCIDPRAPEHLVEIGPGQAALTEHLMDFDIRLDVVEIDRDLAAALTKRFQSIEGFQLHCCNALKFDFATLAKEDAPLRVVGNLPYNISTPLLFHLLAQRHVISDMHFMLQKEVVERMAASPGDHEYGRLSVMVQYYCQVGLLFIVPATAFTPQPKVQSAFARLQPYAELPHVANDEKVFAQLVQTAFNHRRKALRNSLRSWFTQEQITAQGISPLARPEELSVAKFVRLANSVP